MHRSGSRHWSGFLGACGLLIFMFWWLWQLVGPVEPVVPAGWLHGLFMIHGVLAPVVLGFLLTVIPHWTGASGTDTPMMRRLTWALFAFGLISALFGSNWATWIVLVGWMLITIGWGMALYAVFGLWLGAHRRAVQAGPVVLGLFLGAASSCAVVVWLVQGDWRWAFLAMGVGFWGFLLPVFVSIAHRMIPFLSGNQLRHPRALLHGFVLLCIGHLALELRHAYHLLWLADIPLLLLASWAGWRWRCWQTKGNRLAVGLCVAWGMLWLGLALAVLQDIQLARTGGFVLGRAPQHLIGIGFFGAMLVIMTTRKLLDEKRYRRPMVIAALIAIGGSCLAALLRAGAELAAVQVHAPSITAFSAGLWIVAVLPWCLVVAAIVLRAVPAIEESPE